MCLYALTSHECDVRVLLNAERLFGNQHVHKLLQRDTAIHVLGRQHNLEM